MTSEGFEAGLPGRGSRDSSRGLEAGLRQDPAPARPTGFDYDFPLTPMIPGGIILGAEKAPQ